MSITKVYYFCVFYFHIVNNKWELFLSVLFRPCQLPVCNISACQLWMCTISVCSFFTMSFTFLYYFHVSYNVSHEYRYVLFLCLLFSPVIITHFFFKSYFHLVNNQTVTNQCVLILCIWLPNCLLPVCFNFVCFTSTWSITMCVYFPCI